MDFLMQIALILKHRERCLKVNLSKCNVVLLYICRNSPGFTVNREF